MFDFDQLGHDLFFEAPRQKEFAFAVILGIVAAALLFFDQPIFGWSFFGVALSCVRSALSAVKKEREQLREGKATEEG